MKKVLFYTYWWRHHKLENYWFSSLSQIDCPILRWLSSTMPNLKRFQKVSKFAQSLKNFSSLQQVYSACANKSQTNDLYIKTSYPKTYCKVPIIQPVFQTFQNLYSSTSVKKYVIKKLTWKGIKRFTHLQKG